MLKVLVGINENDTVYDKIYDEENIDTLNFDFYVGYDYIFDSYYIYFNDESKIDGDFVHKCFHTFDSYLFKNGFDVFNSEFTEKNRVLRKLCVDGINVHKMFDNLEDVWNMLFLINLCIYFFKDSTILRDVARSNYTS